MIFFLKSKKKMNIISIWDNKHYKYYKNITSVRIRLDCPNLSPTLTQIEFKLKKPNQSST